VGQSVEEALKWGASEVGRRRWLRAAVGRRSKGRRCSRQRCKGDGLGAAHLEAKTQEN
jgi:hypothetical protein